MDVAGALELLEEESWDAECDANNASAIIPDSTQEAKTDDEFIPNSTQEAKTEDEFIPNSTQEAKTDDEFIPNSTQAKTDDTPEEGVVKSMLKFIALTIKEAVEETVQISDRLFNLQKRYKEDGQEFPNELSWSIWWKDTKELQTRLENLNLELDEDCTVIFSHCFFLNAVYVHPKYAYDISYLLLGFLENTANSKEKKEDIIQHILDYIYSVFDKATIYDEYADPPDPSTKHGAECLGLRNLLEIEYPALKTLNGNKKNLTERLRARYLNTANFFANLMVVIHDRGYDYCFQRFLNCLTVEPMDVTSFLAVDQILGLCGYLIKENAVLNTCLGRLATFIGELDPNHPKIGLLKRKLKKIYLELVKKPKMEIPDKLKILYLIYPLQMKQPPPDIFSPTATTTTTTTVVSSISGSTIVTIVGTEEDEDKW